MIKKIFVTFLCVVLTASCESGNILEEYSNTRSDEALYFEAKELINDFDWDGAIQILTEDLSESYQARTEVKETLMHAYGGKCGISFFDFIEGLKNNSSEKMFEIAMALFAGRTVDMEACDRSLATLHNISENAANRTSQQNLFAAILGMTRMATTLRAKFDTDNSGLGNGAVDGGTNSCVNSSVNHRLSDEEVNRIAAGVGLLFENLAALGDSLSEGTSGSAFEDAREICQQELNLPVIQDPEDYDGSLSGQTWATLLSKPVGYSPTWVDFGLPADFAEPLNCLNTKDAEVSGKMRRIFRRMIASENMGFGTCNFEVVDFNFNVNTLTATVTPECCPPPVLVAP